MTSTRYRGKSPSKCIGGGPRGLFAKNGSGDLYGHEEVARGVQKDSSRIFFPLLVHLAWRWPGQVGGQFIKKETERLKRGRLLIWSIDYGSLAGDGC